MAGENENNTPETPQSGLVDSQGRPVRSEQARREQEQRRERERREGRERQARRQRREETPDDGRTPTSLNDVRTRGQAERFVVRFKQRMEVDPSAKPFENFTKEGLEDEFTRVLRIERSLRVDLGDYKATLIDRIKNLPNQEEGRQIFANALDRADKEEAEIFNASASQDESEDQGAVESSEDLGETEEWATAENARAEWQKYNLRRNANRIGKDMTPDQAAALSESQEAQARQGIGPAAGTSESRQRVSGEKRKLRERRGVVEQQIEEVTREIRSLTTYEALRDQLANRNSVLGQKIRNMLSFELERDREEVEQQIQEIIAETNRTGSRDALIKEIIGYREGATREEMDAARTEGLIGAVREAQEEKARDWQRVPANIQELSKFIMEREFEFSRYGDHPILDRETNEFREDNFMRWARKSAMYWHGFDPDADINLFNQVGFYSGQRQYSFNEMYKNDNYFTDAKTGKVMEQFREKVMHELWLFTISHNMDATYRKSMGDDSGLPKVIQQMYYSNTFTKNSSGKSTLEWILTMPSSKMQKENKSIVENTQVGEALRRAILTYYYLTDFDMLKKVYGEDVGDIALFNKYHVKYDSGKPVTIDAAKGQRVATENGKRVIMEKQKDANGNFTNEEKKIADIPEDALVETRTFKDTTTGEDVTLPVILIPGKGGAGHSGADDAEWSDKWFDESGKFKEFMRDGDGNLVRNTKAIKDFTGYINIWNDVQRDLNSVTTVRERIRQSIMKMHGISYEDAEYAENWAFTIGRWAGIGGKNDDGAVGFDAWTKVQNFKDYRMRQFESRRGGLAGNYYNLDVIKRIGVDFFNGAITTEGKSILELIQGGQGTKIAIEAGDIKDVRFRDNTMNKFADDHVTRCFGIFHKLTEGGEFDFDQAVEWDERNLSYAINPEKLAKITDGLQKELRNAYSTFKQLDFSKKIRYYEKDYAPEPHKRGHQAKDPVFKTTSIAEMLFGREVMHFVEEKFEEELEHAKLHDPEKYKKMVTDHSWDSKEELEAMGIDTHHLHGHYDVGKIYDKDRNYNWREVMKMLVVADVTSHHHAESRYKQWTIGQIDQFWHAMEAIPGGIEIDPNDHRNIKVTKNFWTEEEVEHMRKKTNTGFWGMFLRETLYYVMAGLTAGVGTGVKEAAQGEIKALGK